MGVREGIAAERLTHDGDVGRGPDGARVGRGAHLALVLAVVLQRHALDDQVVFALGRVARVPVARVTGHVALEPWGKEGEESDLTSPRGEWSCLEEALRERPECSWN